MVHHDAATFAAFRARSLSNDPESFATINRMLAAENIEHELAEIDCPVLLTAGRHGQTWALTCAREPIVQV